MSQKAISPLRKAWYKWKALRLPWRKRFLAGLDLEGNTYWEFRDTLSSHKHRMRRIVKYPRSVHYSEIKIPPQWHQWLRHTRQDAPSIAEQEQDVVRRENLKILAAQADARWAAKASFLDHPGQARGQALPATEEVGVRDLADGKPGHTVQGTDTKVGSGMAGGQKGEQAGTTDVPGREQHRLNERAVTDDKPKQKKFKEDPWKKARGGPSEEWQPEAWDGSIAPTKRR